MRKIYLILAALVMSISLNSCSGDGGSGSAGGTLTCKINGVAKSFKVFPEEDTGYLFVDSYIGSANNPTEMLYLELYLNGEMTDSPIDNLIYSNPNEVNGSTTVLSHTLSKNTHSISGTFSATITNVTGGDPDINITEGQFSFRY